MALWDWPVKSSETGVSQATGIKRRTVVFEIPSTSIADERPEFEPSTDNKWDADDDSLYASCILNARETEWPGRPDAYKVTVEYGPPTVEMILQPGRGLPGFRTGAQAKRVYWGRKFVSGYSPESAKANRTLDAVMTTTMFTKGHESQLFPFPVLIVTARDYAEAEQEISNEAAAWLGFRGELGYWTITKGNRAMLFDAAVNRTNVHAGWLDIQYVFHVDIDDAWEYEFQDLYKRFPYTEMPSGRWEPVSGPERGVIARGEATFTRVENYLAWLNPTS